MRDAGCRAREGWCGSAREGSSLLAPWPLVLGSLLGALRGRPSDLCRELLVLGGRRKCCGLGRDGRWTMDGQMAGTGARRGTAAEQP